MAGSLHRGGHSPSDARMNGISYYGKLRTARSGGSWLYVLQWCPNGQPDYWIDKIRRSRPTHGRTQQYFSFHGSIHLSQLLTGRHQMLMFVRFWERFNQLCDVLRIVSCHDYSAAIWNRRYRDSFLRLSHRAQNNFGQTVYRKPTYVRRAHTFAEFCRP